MPLRVSSVSEFSTVMKMVMMMKMFVCVIIFSEFVQHGNEDNEDSLDDCLYV